MRSSALGSVERCWLSAMAHGSRSLLADEAGEEAFGLRLEVAASEGDAVRVAEMVRQVGADTVVADGNLRWALFDVLHEHETELALDLVREHLDAAPSPQGLRTDGARASALRCAFRCSMRCCCVSQRWRCFKSASTARLAPIACGCCNSALCASAPLDRSKDLIELGSRSRVPCSVLHTARRLLIRFDGDQTILRTMMRAAAECSLLEETIEPVLLCASNLDHHQAIEPARTSGSGFARAGREGLARVVVSQIDGADLRAPAALMAQSCFKRGRAGRTRLSAALEVAVRAAHQTRAGGTGAAGCCVGRSQRGATSAAADARAEDGCL